jgi:hypothetical protein
MDSNHTPNSPPSDTNWSRINQWLWLGLAAAVGWLVVRHGTHLAELLPFLLILACPLMHLFGHGHGKSHNSQGEK